MSQTFLCAESTQCIIFSLKFNFCTKNSNLFKVYKGIAHGFRVLGFHLIKNERKSNFLNRMLNEVVVCINSKCISSNKSLEELQAAFLILTEELPKSTATKTLSNESPL